MMLSVGNQHRELIKEKENEEFQRRIGDWMVIRTLGFGSTSKVQLAMHTSSLQFSAIKCISHCYSSTSKEISIVQSLSHPNILKLFEVIRGNFSVYLVFEYCPKELFEFIQDQEQGKLQLDQAICIFKAIVKGVAYLHQRNIAHRDLKLENILIDNNFNVKIADFGMAEHCLEYLNTFCGSPHYACPEIFSGIPYDGKKADSWSLGVILYALLTGDMPFYGNPGKELTRKIQNAEYIVPDPQEIPFQWIILVSKLLEVDPNKRISAEEILKLEYFL
jgi:serine/threonine protein kinase